MKQAAVATTVPSLRPSPRLRDRLAARLVLARLSSLRAGSITLVLPDGAVLRYGDSASERHVTITVKSWAFFWRTLAAADIGGAESYVEGQWAVSDLVELCRLFLIDQSMLDAGSGWTAPVRLRHALLRWVRTNTLARARQNIRHHYDLGNEFYALFLDESMTYSCAYFENDAATLEEAQQAKIERLCRFLDLTPGLEVLEIGSGWGALAIHLARRYGCRVTSLTLSEQQLEFARRRAAEAGMSDRVDFRLCDYRQAEGCFDRIVSVEMLEAVGYEYFATFFGRCAKWLRPGGKLVLQTISVPDQSFDAYRRDFDFIRKYIFPGGLCPSLYEILRAVKERTNFRLVALEDIGSHYARTLRCWRERFLARLLEARRLGFDERVLRMWEYYLASCEAAFSVRHIGNLQIVLRRPGIGSN